MGPSQGNCVKSEKDLHETLKSDPGDGGSAEPRWGLGRLRRCRQSQQVLASCLGLWELAQTRLKEKESEHKLGLSEYECHLSVCQFKM